jgi:hypothetical protein
MFPLAPLQPFRRLDKLSPKFPDQLANLLNGKKYRICLTKLQDDDASWLVGFLDDVRF